MIRNALINLALVFFISGFVGISNAEEKYQCPLTPGYMSVKLNELSKLIKDTQIEPNNTQVNSLLTLSNHYERIAGDALKNEWYPNKENCSYFMLAVHTEVLSRFVKRAVDCKKEKCTEYDKHSLGISLTIEKIEPLLKQCESWLDSNFKDMELNLETIYCKNAT